MQSSGSNNYFRATSFVMGSNQSLVINSDVTLLASTYSASQFISVASGASNIGIYGPGVIDGNATVSTGNRVISTVNPHSNLVIYNLIINHSGYPSIYVKSANGATVWGVTVNTAATVSNADCIDIDSSTNVTVNKSYLSCGDDGVAIKTNASAATNITVENTSIHGSHGFSVGSQTFNGVSNVLFQNNYVYGQDEFGNNATDNNAIRIKTDPTCGGSVDRVTYLNTCITGAKHLIQMNPAYGTCSGSPGIPWFTNIVIDGVYSQNSVSGAYSQYNGYDANHLMTLWLANVSLDVTTQSSASFATVGFDNSNVIPSGPSVTTFPFSSNGSVPACSF